MFRAPLPSVSVLGVLRYATSTRIMDNDSGALVGTFIRVYIKNGLTAEAPLNEMTDNGAHTTK